MSLLSRPFEVGARLRGARVFHPRGVVLRTTWVSAGECSALAGSALLDGERPALVRVSRAVGLPPWLPDILGLAIRIEDVYGAGVHQDLLLATSGRGRLGRHVLVPRWDLAGGPWSSLLPYTTLHGHRRAIVAQAAPGSVRTTAEEVLRDGAARMPTFEVRFGTVDGPMIATVVPTPGDRVSAPIAEALGFDPWNAGPELRPAGVLNRLRPAAYAGSRRGRGAAMRTAFTK
jgi:hypothetical protein